MAPRNVVKIGVGDVNSLNEIAATVNRDGEREFVEGSQNRC